MTSKQIFGFINQPDAAINALFQEIDVTLLPAAAWASRTDTPAVLVLGGGADINPALYYEKKDTRTMTTSQAVDLRDQNFITEAKMLSVPVVGICRGLQAFHVNVGGTINQHIDGHRGGSHELLAAEGKKRTGIHVNSTHHQAVPEDQATTFYDEVYLGQDSKKGFHAEFVTSELMKFVGAQFHPERATCSNEGRALFLSSVKRIMK